MPVYLDYNASTPVLPEVIDVMIDAYNNHYGNIDSRTHKYGLDANSLVESARKSISTVLNLEFSDRLVFTSGATESNNIGIMGLAEYAKETGKTHFITTSIEHKSVLEPMKYLQRQGFEVDFIDPDQSGRVNADEVLSKVRTDTALVSVMHVNSETGIIQPVKEIGNALHDSEAYFHIDATQSFGKLDNDIRTLKYDIMSFAAHKIRGPQGIGALALKRSNYELPSIKPIIMGGDQEQGFRPGTTPIALTVGFATASELAHKSNIKHMAACATIKNRLLGSLMDVDYQVNGDPKYCIANTINVSFNGIDADRLMNAVMDYYALSKGSACTAQSREPSYVLKAMGLEMERIRSAIRFSWDYDTEVSFDSLVKYVKSMQK